MAIYQESRGAERLRRMYAGGRGDAAARAFARLWGGVFALGLQPRRWVTLEVVGRRSGQVRRFPLGLARLDGRWYAVSMLGECAWTRNVRAADEVTFLWRGRHQVRLVEVPVADRPPVLAAYLDQVPGGRPHLALPPGRPVADYAEIAARHPTFAVTST